MPAKEELQYISPEQEEVPHVTYKEFLITNIVEPGTLITNVKPQDLFTYQDWIEDHKTASVMGRATEGDPTLFFLSGYLHHHTKFDENVLVIGNGHHRALLAMSTDQKVNVLVTKEPIEKNKNPFRITNLLKKYGDVFSGF